MQVLQNVVLNNWILSLCSILGSRQVTANAVTKSEDVFVFFVLQRVFIHVDEPFVVAKTGIKDQLLWLAWWVDASSEERLFDRFAIVDVAENSNLLVELVFLDFKHFPTEAYVNSTLVALIKSNFISVWELVYLFVGREVLDASASC